MRITFRVGSGDVSSLSLNIAVYNCLTSRSAMAVTVNGGAVGVIESETTVPVSSLSPDGGGDVNLTIPVDDGTTPVTGTGPLTAQLHCASGATGVYPVRLTLTNSPGGGKTQIFTYLVYANAPADTQRLRLAWVVPVNVPPSTGTVAEPSSAVDGVAQLLSSVSSHSDVALTLVPSAQALSTLSSSTRSKARDALNMLSTLAAGGDEVLAQGYAPVDAEALVSASLSTELSQQVRRAQAVLSPLHPSGAVWLAGGALGQATLIQLENLGFTRVVIPASAVTLSGAQSLTPTLPFTLPAGKGLPPLAAESDTGLTNHLGASDNGDPALAAYQFLADLAVIYYEQPNLDTARGVVAVPPAGWTAQATFLNTVLSALQSDPLVEPVTVDDFFATVPFSTLGHRLSTPAPSASGLPSSAIRSLRSRLSAFSSAVGTTGASTVRMLDDDLLAAEDTRLHAGQQSAAVTDSSRALDAQLKRLSIRTDTIRLTSTAAKVPITIIKAPGYQVTGVLSVSGDKVEFPSGSAQSPGAVCASSAVRSTAGRSTFECTATIAQSTNAVYIAMRARVSGDFRLTVKLTSPTGGLVMATDQVTVRSVSVSAVAIALSAAAVAVLLLWWGRTVLRGRPQRGAHARRRRAEAKAGTQEAP